MPMRHIDRAKPVPARRSRELIIAVIVGDRDIITFRCHGPETSWWPTPGRYLRESMLSALTRCVANVDDAGFFFFLELVNGHSFPSLTRL